LGTNPKMPTLMGMIYNFTGKEEDQFANRYSESEPIRKGTGSPW